PPGAMCRKRGQNSGCGSYLVLVVPVLLIAGTVPRRSRSPDKPSDDELAATSFAPATTWRIFWMVRLDSRNTAPLVECPNSAEARPLRSQKNDSGKTGKHVWRLVFWGFLTLC